MNETTNSPNRHTIVVVVSGIVPAALYLLGYHYQEVTTAIAYFLLFLTVITGLLLVVWPGIRRRFKGKFLVNWRSKLGIWFVTWTVIHVALVVEARGIDILWGSS